jgi:predicted nucleotidyltransferase
MDKNQINTANPTPYSGINSVLRLFLSRVQRVLGKNFVGLYLHGSLATGDFNIKRSDIDFLVVTAEEVSDQILPALKAMHEGIAASGLDWATKLEGPYISQASLRRFDPAQAKHPWLGADGNFSIQELGIDWIIQLYIIREYGITVAGPNPQALIDPIEPDHLRQAELRTLQEWWLPQLQNPVRLQSSEYQTYAILTMCRALYTLQHGVVVSKPAAAEWTQKALGEPWAGLIELALIWERGMPLDKLDETLDFIRYILRRSEEFKQPTSLT